MMLAVNMMYSIERFESVIVITLISAFREFFRNLVSSVFSLSVHIHILFKVQCIR